MALTSVVPVPDGSRRAAPSSGVPTDESLDSPPGSANGPGHGKVETCAGAASRQPSAAVEGEPRAEGDRHRLISQAAVQPAATAASVADELQRQDRHLLSEDCVFRVGDTVLASTAGRPSREATVVEADPSNGSRFKVAFKDKRKKGGWRDKSELSSLFRPTDAGSAQTATVPLPSSSAAAGEARPAPPQQRRDYRNEVDAATAAAAPGPSLAADSETKSGKEQPPCSEVVASESPAALAAAVSDEAQRQGHPLPSGGCLFQIGDAVLASSAGKAAAASSEATVVEVDPSDGSRFKVTFKDRRKKGGWRDKSELLSAVRHTGAGSTAAGQRASEPAYAGTARSTDGGGGNVGAEPAAGLPQPGASDTSSAPACSSTAVEAEPVPQSDRRPSTAAVVGTHEPSEAAPPVPAPASPSGHLFRVGEAVLVSAAGKASATASFEATVLEVDPCDSSRFRVAFKNKRKKGGWRHRSELSALLRRTGARSTAARPASGSVGDAGAAGGSSASHEKSRAGVLGQGGRASEAPALGAASETRAGAKTPPGQGLQRSVSQRERPAAKVGTKAAAPTVDTTAVGEIGAVSVPPKRKRSVATAAAGSITATAGSRGRGGSGSTSGGGVESIRKKPVKKGGQAKRGSVAAGGAAAGITKKTPRKKGWQRPTVVTPGSVEGRPESALRLVGLCVSGLGNGYRHKFSRTFFFLFNTTPRAPLPTHANDPHSPRQFNVFALSSPPPRPNTGLPTRRRSSGRESTSRSNRPSPGPARAPPCPHRLGERHPALPSRQAAAVLAAAALPVACSASRPTPFETPSVEILKAVVAATAAAGWEEEQGLMTNRTWSGVGGARGGRCTRACRRTPWRPPMAASRATTAAVLRAAMKTARALVLAAATETPLFVSARARLRRGGREICRSSRLVMQAGGGGGVLRFCLP